MTTHVLDVTWPIVDRDTPLNELRAEAIELIRERCRAEGWTITGRPSIHIGHGAQPVLRVTVDVRVEEATAA